MSGMFERREAGEQQREFWIATDELPAATPDGFYRRVNRTLEKIGFAQEVRAICAPAYADAARGGRPGIDPVVYLKMLMVGFFEDLPSERAIASRCADSLSIRGFLGYGLSEATPDHSSLSVIRTRLGQEQFHAIHVILLRAMRANGLLKGCNLGIDSSVIEANASLRALQHRNSEENYWDYVKRLAVQAGIAPADTKAVRRFDKKRPDRKTSNREWVNPHEPEAKVGRTKDGACDMIHKPEHVSDLDSGAIILPQVRPGDAADSVGVAERVMAAVGTLMEAIPDADEEQLGATCTADEGYFAVEEIGELNRCGVRTIISDPHEGRRRAAASAGHSQTLHRARRAVKSKSGKALLRKRGEDLERGFCHVLDHGGLRRATLRGRENLTKRHTVAAMTFNLSLLLRALFGKGTTKQWLAGASRALLRRILALYWHVVRSQTPIAALRSFFSACSRLRRHFLAFPEMGRFSTDDM